MKIGEIHKASPSKKTACERALHYREPQRGRYQADPPQIHRGRGRRREAGWLAKPGAFGSLVRYLRGMRPPMRSQQLSNQLSRLAEADPQRCAVASTRVVLSYAELDQRVRSVAERLRESSIGDHSVVGIRCSNDATHLELALALDRLGATSCTVPSFEGTDEQEQLLRKIGATDLVGANGEIEKLPAAPGALDPVLASERSTKFLFSTSGTTGEAKIVCHTSSGLGLQAHRHVEPHERFGCLASMEHNFAKRHRLYCLAQGGTNVFLDSDPAALIENARTLGLSTLHVSLFQAHELLAIPGIEALRSLRLKLGGSHVAAPVRAELRERITEDLLCGYGTTETGAIAFTAPQDKDAAESVGHTLDGIEVRIVDENRDPVDRETRGEVAIRSEGMFLGYLGRSAETSACLDDDGWFYTGDLGYLDSSMRLHLAGRSDDMFVFNSVNIIPQDLEAEILEFPAVVDALVVPQPSPVHGDIPVALVVFDAAETPDLRELKRFVKARAGIRCPRKFTRVDAIPRSHVGKALRREARALVLSQEA